MDGEYLRNRIDKSVGHFLRRHHFREKSFSVDEKYFGNSVFELESSDFKIRFATDRGDLYVDVSRNPDTDGWFPFGFLLELFGYRWGHTAGMPDAEIANLFEKEYGQIAGALREPSIASMKRSFEAWSKQDRPLLQ